MAALAGEVCCHWSPGSGRLLPLGTFPTGGRERRGGPSWPQGPALQVSFVEPILAAKFSCLLLVDNSWYIEKTSSNIRSLS